MKKLLAVLACFGMAQNVNALDINKLSDRQVELMIEAYAAGDKIGFPETIQAILVQESRVGEAGVIGDNIAAFCPMQVQIQAAEHMSKVYADLKEYSKSKYAEKLLFDDNYCFTIATRYFKHNKERLKNYKRAIAGYNMGTGTALTLTDTEVSNVKYVQLVLKHLKFVRQFNEKYADEINTYLKEHNQVSKHLATN